MRALVTGGAGFIGSHVVDALVARGDDVHVLDNMATGRRENVAEGADLTVGDVREPLGELFDEVAPEVCFHLAAQADVRVSVERPDYDAEVNVLGTIRVLEAARRNGTHIVFTSTGGAMYGECARPAPETADEQPLSPYGVSKLSGEEYLATSNRLHRTGHVSLRLGNVYGPRQDPHGEAGVVGVFFRCLRTGETGRIFGDGRQTRDYVYIGDAVRAMLASVGQDGGVFNVGTGVPTSVIDLYELCRRVSGVDAEPQFAPARLGELQNSALDVTLAARQLGWRAERDLEAGLRATWEWLSRDGTPVRRG